MERRKFVIGAGALATGSAAAVGSGAFSQAEVDRTVNAEVVNDADAYVGLDVPSDYQSSNYAEKNSGQLTITLNDVSEVDGEGLNANAVTHFDELFRITNQNSDGHRVGIAVDRDGLDNPDVFNFYQTTIGSEDRENLGGQGFGEEDPEGFAPYMEAGDSIAVGVEVDTTGIDPEDFEESGTIAIQAETENPVWEDD